MQGFREAGKVGVGVAASDPGGALLRSHWPELIGSCWQREVGKVVHRHPAPELQEGTE